MTPGLTGCFCPADPYSFCELCMGAEVNPMKGATFVLQGTILVKQ